LVEQETQHEERLQKILDEKSGGDKARVKSALDKYNKMGQDDTMFQKAEIDTIKDKNTMMMEAFNVAANMEKKGIDIYLGMENAAEDKELKEFLHDLALQELRHKKQIISMGMSLFGMPSEEEEVTPEKEEEELRQQKTVIKEFEMVAKDGHWQPGSVTVEKGNTVVLKLKAVGAPVGFRQTAFMIDEFIGADQEVEVKFIADTAGEFEFFSNVPYVGGNEGFRGKIVVKGENEEDDAL
ncbi:cupredoxin domain-containing protein, partial [Candidatus Woesearchaeota archaeon]|nr:cupredoxin domain-containing protein [Candidatus Woesearchaeota archaeon]